MKKCIITLTIVALLALIIFPMASFADAFVVSPSEVPSGDVVDPDAPDSPQTGEEFPWAMVAGAVAFGAMGAGILYTGHKKAVGE